MDTIKTIRDAIYQARLELRQAEQNFIMAEADYFDAANAMLTAAIAKHDALTREYKRVARSELACGQ